MRAREPGQGRILEPLNLTMYFLPPSFPVCGKDHVRMKRIRRQMGEGTRKALAWVLLAGSAAVRKRQRLMRAAPEIVWN